MKDIIKAFDDLPWVLKIILALPGLDFIWGIYRIIKGVMLKNDKMLFAGIVWVILGAPLLWIIDLYHVCVEKKVVLFA